MGELFENDDITVLISLPEFSSNTNFKMTDDCYVFKFLQRGVNGKHLMRFQTELTVFKFLQLSAGERGISYTPLGDFRNFLL